MTDNPSKRTATGTTAGIVLFFLLTVGGPIGLRHYLFQAFKIPSGSMYPAVLVGDHVMVNKRRTAARGDIVVFPFPEHPKQDFIKRIVGLPGDRLEFRAGHPVVNGAEVPSCRVGTASYDDPEHHDGDVYLERLGERSHLTFYDHASGAFDTAAGPYLVASGEVFVVGDNRFNAHDSRMWWGGKGGGVPIASLTGVPSVVWLSSSDKGIDWSRVGLDLDEPHLPESMKELAPSFEKCLAELR